MVSTLCVIRKMAQIERRLNFHNFQVLDLSYTGLASLPAHSLHSPRFLDELRLDGNLFQEVPTDALADTHVLKILTLDDNPIKNMFIHTFPFLPSLEHLSLSYLPNLTVVGPETFAGMPSLEELILTDNVHLQYIDPEAFKGQTDSDHWSLRRVSQKLKIILMCALPVHAIVLKILKPENIFRFKSFLHLLQI